MYATHKARDVLLDVLACDVPSVQERIRLVPHAHVTCVKHRQQTLERRVEDCVNVDVVEGTTTHSQMS